MNANAGTIADETKQPNSRKSDAERSVVYRPAGATEDMTLTMAYVRGFLTTPTKQGHKPTEADIIKFMMLCKESHLNPWQGDAYLIGYDSEDGPVFNLITAVQALLKRAELSHEFDGIESGVVASKNGELIERKGTLLLVGERLLGGWARCFRKDRGIPFYQTVQFEVYNTGRARWHKDPAGMIVKCAKAAVLREAFPNSLAGLYVDEEMEGVVTGQTARTPSGPAEPAVQTRSAEDLTEALKAKNSLPATALLPPSSAPNPLRISLTSELQMATSPQAIDSIEADYIEAKDQLTDQDCEAIETAIAFRRGTLA